MISLKNLIYKKRAEILQFIKFSLVGVSNCIVSYSINILMLFVLSPIKLDYDYMISNAVSFVLSVLWSFYWNNKLVFIIEDGQKRSKWKALLKTYVSYSITGIFLASFMLWLWVDILGISKYIAPLINVAINTPINFFLNKFWAFKTKK